MYVRSDDRRRMNGMRCDLPMEVRKGPRASRNRHTLVKIVLDGV